MRFVAFSSHQGHVHNSAPVRGQCFAATEMSRPQNNCALFLNWWFSALFVHDDVRWQTRSQKSSPNDNRNKTVIRSRKVKSTLDPTVVCCAVLCWEPELGWIAASRALLGIDSSPDHPGGHVARGLWDCYKPSMFLLDHPLVMSAVDHVLLLSSLIHNCIRSVNGQIITETPHNAGPFTAWCTVAGVRRQ